MATADDRRGGVSRVSAWADAAAGVISPRWQLGRVRARAEIARVSAYRNASHSHFDAASGGRRTDGWLHRTSDADSAIQPAAFALRAASRDLINNNANAAAAVRVICDDMVGAAGMRPTATTAAWDEWAGTARHIDADGIHDFAGLQQLAVRTTVSSGDCYIRRRWRRPSDRLPLPFQIQLLEPDFIDETHDRIMQNGHRIRRGVEFDAIGRRVAYWMYRAHPGSWHETSGTIFGDSIRVPASEILHLYRCDRPGQTAGFPWMAPCMLMLHDFDEFADATLMKQKIASMLAVITSDNEGGTPPLGAAVDNAPELDHFEPGGIHNIGPGRDIKIVDPPSTTDYAEFVKVTLRQVAAGVGITYEDLTGDYSDASFSHSRLSRIRHWSRVRRWRSQMLVPQFCGPVFSWAMEAAQMMGMETADNVQWIGEPLPMIEPDKEGLAASRNVRAGITTMYEAIRERGKDPEQHLQEIADGWERADELGLVMDWDPRQMTQQGQLQGEAAAEAKGLESELTGGDDPDPDEMMAGGDDDEGAQADEGDAEDA